MYRLVASFRSALSQVSFRYRGILAVAAGMRSMYSSFIVFALRGNGLLGVGTLMCDAYDISKAIVYIGLSFPTTGRMHVDEFKFSEFLEVPVVLINCCGG
jgi:hypothetical protein